MSKALAKAMNHYSKGDFAAATEDLRPALRNLKTVDGKTAMLMAQCCYKLQRLPEAAIWFERAAADGGENAMMLAFLSANLYWQVKNPKKALGLTRRILDKQPNHWEARALYRKCLRFLLQFDAFEKDSETFVPLIEKGDISALHCEKLLDNLQWYDNEIVQSTLTGVDANVPYSASLRRMRPHGYGDKIRIGYLSNDFSDRHATMHLFQGVLKAHDRSKFTVTLFCHTDEDVIAVDEGFRSGNAEIAPIAGLNDADAAALIRSHSIDILVD
ncbi:MAG: hypothetical protein RIR97_1935, partial [Pseudomonadota bacterium]